MKYVGNLLFVLGVFFGIYLAVIGAAVVVHAPHPNQVALGAAAVLMGGIVTAGGVLESIKAFTGVNYE